MNSSHGKLFYTLATTFAITSMATLAPPAFAQERQRSAVLEEVLVTAQRREESAQDVAISMTVFNQDQIANANLVNTADLAVYTPSLSINPRFGTENASFTIRGFAQELRTTASVGVYFAEVIAPRGQNIQTSGDGAGPGMMFDLQNIQVLQGPQGTLFGRNTTGGAVLITPQRPTQDFEGYVEISAGNFGMRQQQAVVNLPLHDRVRLRLGIDNHQRDGHLNNVVNIGASKLGDVNYTAARLGLVVDVTDRIENYTLVNYSDSDTKGQTSQLFACSDASPTESPLVAFTGPGCQNQLARQQATGQDGFYDLVSTVPNPGVEIEDLRIINTLNWDLTDNISLKNILAYSHLKQENESDVFGAQFTETQAVLLNIPGLPSTIVADERREFSPGVTMRNPAHPVTSQETFVAELQAQGSSFGRRMQWQGGLYYENSQPDGSSGNISPIIITCELASVAAGDPDQFNCFDPLGGALGAVLVQNVRTEYLNRAVYGQASYDIFEQLTVTGGLRYTRDKAEATNRGTLHRFALSERQEPPTQINTNPKAESSAPTGLIELQYRPFQDVMLYAKYTRGYRQGSVNPAADEGVDSHDEETVDTYEIGAKTQFEWPIPGRFNIAVFDNELTDMQLQTGYVSPTAGPTTSIFNAGRAVIRGVEFDGMLQLYEGLTATFAFAYLDTELKEQNLEENRQQVEDAGGFLAGATFAPNAEEGDELPFAPKLSYTISLNYRLPLPVEIGMVSVGATYAHVGEQRSTSSTASPFSIVDSYSIINLNAKWMDIFGQPLDLSLFATNVRDEEYVIYTSGTFFSLGFESRQMGLPRMYGARLRYNF